MGSWFESNATPVAVMGDGQDEALNCRPLEAIFGKAFLVQAIPKPEDLPNSKKSQWIFRGEGYGALFAINGPAKSGLFCFE